MSEGKMSYERKKARAEIRAEMREQYGTEHNVQEARQRDTFTIYAGSILLLAFGEETEHSATRLAFELLEAAKQRAKLLTPGPDTEQDDADD